MQRNFKIVNGYAKKRLQQLRYQFENMTAEQQRTSPKMIHSFLLEAKGDKNTYLTDQALVHQITNYFFAGADVNATVYTWMIIKTFENPEI